MSADTLKRLIQAVKPYVCSFDASTLWGSSVCDVLRTPAARRCSRATRATLKTRVPSLRFKDAVLNMPLENTADIVRNLCSCVISDSDLSTFSSRLCLSVANYAKYCFERRGLSYSAIISEHQFNAMTRVKWLNEIEAEEVYWKFKAEGELSGSAYSDLPALSTLFLCYALSLTPICRLDDGWLRYEFRTHMNDLAARHVAICVRTTLGHDLRFARAIALHSVYDVLQLMEALDYAALYACSVRDGTRYDGRTMQLELNEHQTAFFWHVVMSPGGWYPDTIKSTTA